jgi:hypothetical protein
MRNSLKTLTAVVTTLPVLGAFLQEASAEITMNGVIQPGGTPVTIIEANESVGPNDSVKFKFSAPAPQPGGYVLSFCIGPKSNPCGLPTSYVINVPASEERLAIVNASVFVNNVLVVGQGTTSPVPFAVTVE